MINIEMKNNTKNNFDLSGFTLNGGRRPAGGARDPYWYLQETGELPQGVSVSLYDTSGAQRTAGIIGKASIRIDGITTIGNISIFMSKFGTGPVPALYLVMPGRRGNDGRYHADVTIDRGIEAYILRTVHEKLSEYIGLTSKETGITMSVLGEIEEKEDNPGEDEDSPF